MREHQVLLPEKPPNWIARSSLKEAALSRAPARGRRPCAVLSAPWRASRERPWFGALFLFSRRSRSPDTSRRWLFAGGGQGDHVTATNSAPAGASASAPIDQYFLSVNGQLQGPFTRSQLEQRPVVPGSWIWKAGQDVWVAWSAPTTKGSLKEAIEPEKAQRTSTGTPSEGTATSTVKLVGGTASTGVLYFLCKVFMAGTLWWSNSTEQGTAGKGRPEDAVSATHRPVAVPVATPGPPAPLAASAQGVLTRGDLGIASAYVEVRWQTAAGASGGCTGTASPAVLTGDILVLLTNAHLLDLSELLATKPDGGLQITQY